MAFSAVNSYTQACDREIERALGHNFPVGKVPAIADAGARCVVYRADAIRQCFADLASGEFLYALRGLFYIREMHGRCGGTGPAVICDAIRTLQGEIEDAVRAGKGVR